MKPLTATELAPLLDILENPASPAFTQAVERLRDLDPATLPTAQAPALLARIESVLTKLTEQKALTAKQLSTLRTGNKALKSYTNLR